MKVKELRQKINIEIEKAKKNGTFGADRYYLYFSYDNILADVLSALVFDENFVTVLNRAYFKKELPREVWAVLVFKGMPSINTSNMRYYKDIDDYKLVDMLVDDLDMKFIPINRGKKKCI